MLVNTPRKVPSSATKIASPSALLTEPAGDANRGLYDELLEPGIIRIGVGVALGSLASKGVAVKVGVAGIAVAGVDSPLQAAKAESTITTRTPKLARMSPL